MNLPLKGASLYMAIDLHLHTQTSDGTWSPQRIVEEVQKAGLSAFAVTDHDATDALGATAAEAAQAKIPFIPGVEISTSYTQDLQLHILGYGIDPSSHALRSVLSNNQASWEKSEYDSIANLAKLGIHVDIGRYEYWRTQRQQGGWPLLNALREMGVIKGLNDYFTGYFGLGKPAYVEILFVSPVEAVAAIHKAKGVPVLAHPGLYKEEGELLFRNEKFLDEILSWGIEGIEVFSSSHTPEISQELLEVASSHGLLVTGGSDCHGDFAPGRCLGVPVVDDCYLIPLEERIRAKNNSPAILR